MGEGSLGDRLVFSFRFRISVLKIKKYMRNLRSCFERFRILSFFHRLRLCLILAKMKERGLL
jgi:hypothetical protein